MDNNNLIQDYLPIESYGVIGNLHTVALVSLNASIDFMCYPRFDSPTIFCSLLDAQKGGSFSITPLMRNIVLKQLYLPDTNILVSRFLSEDGIVEVIDYMPVANDEGHCMLIRKVSSIHGTVNFDLRCAPRFGYATVEHTIEVNERGYTFVPASGTQPSLQLQSSVSLQQDGKDIISRFTLNEGESACFIAAAPGEDISEDIMEFTEEKYVSTIHYWQDWLNKSGYNGDWSDIIHRSALTLKLLISRKHGSMVAAPTFGLPEAIGQQRNWDYRYTWIRDAAFSMHAFLQLGFTEEAERFLEWLQQLSTSKDLQLMFAVDGKTSIDEYELDDLHGYKGSKPVRIGNDAYGQTQMDIYGELLETIYIFARHGGDITYEYWKSLSQYIEYVIDNWHKPDHSIWEVRGVKREFIFSKIMCWVAIDRGMKIAELFSFPCDIPRWRSVRDEIFIDVYENFWNEEKQSFVQFKGSESLDASVLLMPILNMISPHSERWKKTMDAIGRELRSDVLIYRYLEQEKEVDGLKGKEGTFTMCSFWYVECLALAGETQKAKEYFARMLGYANHLGLYAEQLGMKGEHLGNFPQAFTHLALISAAIELNEAQSNVRYMRESNRGKK